MLNRKAALIGVIVIVLVLPAISLGQETLSNAAGGSELLTIKPNYLTPSKILDFLGARNIEGGNLSECPVPGTTDLVEIRCNDLANLMILSGSHDDIDYVRGLIKQADIPPRQIEIEVQIVEISKNKALDAGIDWDDLVRRSSYIYSSYSYDKTTGGPAYENHKRNDYGFMTSSHLNERLFLLEESGAGQIHSAPKILTLNNQPAQILDGSRITYITNYSSYTNLYETQTMDAGLTLNVLPSLGESGYISLHVEAEMTTPSFSYSNSPSKSGQMIDNTIIAKDGEPVVLGGLTKMVKSSTHKRFPILGHILPFLFSHKISSEDEVRSYIILTPRVVDFNTALDEETQKAIQGN